MRHIELNVDNNDFFVINRVFDQKLADEFIAKVTTYTKPELIIFIHSPGGDLLALARMLDVMEGSDTKFTCVARFAASAAFMLFENCDKRYMLNSGILMSHNASGSFEGEFPRLKNRFEAINGIVEKIEKKIADRLEMSFEEYKRAIANEMWLSYDQAVERNAIDDDPFSISCTQKTIDTTVEVTEEIPFIFGPIEITYKVSLCPLILEAIPVKEDNKL